MAKLKHWATRATLVRWVIALSILTYVYVGQVDSQDQFCTGLEEQHLTEVTALRGTYRYLETLTPKERDTNLTKRVLENLPQVEARARHDVAPDLCDTNKWPVGQLGRPEPDPAIPAQRDFSYIVYGTGSPRWGPK